MTRDQALAELRRMAQIPLDEDALAAMADEDLVAKVERIRRDMAERVARAERVAARRRELEAAGAPPPRPSPASGGGSRAQRGARGQYPATRRGGAP